MSSLRSSGSGASPESDGSRSKESAFGPAISGLSVVVPVFDEEDNVLPLAAEIEAVLAGIRVPSEVLFVDDGSRDATAARLIEARKRFPRLRTIRLWRRQGQSAAIVAGVRAARMSHVVTLDGDLQNDPHDLLLLLERSRTHAIVIGRRGSRRDRLARRFGAWIANSVRRAVLRDGSTDTGCSLKLFPRDALLGLMPFDGMHRFLPALFRLENYSVLEVEVSHRERRSGRSKYSNLSRLPRTLADLLGVLWLTRRAIRPADSHEES